MKKPLIPVIAALFVFAMFLFVFKFVSDGGNDLEDLDQGQVIGGFTAENLYVDGSDRAMGARFISQDKGFIVDLLRIQSVPQGFIWVKSPPDSDRGEPHACEHLLLGKGKQGRYVAALEEMTLGNASAWTAQTNTVYHFNTLGGEDNFYETLEARLNALVNPDFTDEEIRREVAHLSVVENAEGELGFEEKGSVYTEMVSSFEGPGYPLWGGIGDMLYGKDHPLANSSGGHPDSMRAMVPAHMREFVAKTYRLPNMGIIISLPESFELEDVLVAMEGILDRVEPGKLESHFVGMNSLDLPPVTHAAPEGSVQVSSYASDNAEDPGEVLVAWPPRSGLSNFDRFMLEVFLDGFAGGPGTELYDLFINSETRRVDLGASAVWSYLSDDPGSPIFFGLDGLDNRNIDRRTLRRARGLIVEELHKLYELEPGSEELADFNDRVSSNLVQTCKYLDRALNSPPQFGFRRSGMAGNWQDIMAFLELDEGFRKSLVLAPHFAEAEKAMTAEQNYWRQLIDAWGLLEADPYVMGVHPDPTMITAARDAKAARLVAAVANTQEQFGEEDSQKALKKFRDEFDADTAELEAMYAEDVLPGFMDNPPMELDEQLQYETLQLTGGAEMVASTFENMSTSTLQIHFRLDVIPAEYLVYVPLLPSLMRGVGVEMDGERVEYDEMEKRLRAELLSYGANLDTNPETGRVELALSFGASQVDEIDRGLDWMRASLTAPLLDDDNLARLRDLLDQRLHRMRTRMQGSEESWVSDPAAAYRYQDDPLYLSAASFLTQTHQLLRLKWRFTEPSGEGERYLDEVERRGRDRDRGELAALLDQAPETGIEVDIAASLRASLIAVPDASLSEDWAELCNMIRRELAVPPAEAFGEIKEVLALVARAENARLSMVSNSRDRGEKLTAIESFLEDFSGKGKAEVQNYARHDYILQRYLDRSGLESPPTYAGLVNENTRNGTLLFSARVAEHWQADRESALGALTGRLFGGGGGHGFFMRTWATGLAYSNGFGYRENTGLTSYYAERCPDVAETLRFVVDVLEETELDTSHEDYSIAGMFGRSRAAAGYESRGQAMAADITDGFGPDRVRDFRGEVLNLRGWGELMPDMQDRLDEVYGSVLIGYGKPSSESPDGVFFLIGPETQFESLEAYIASVEEPQTVHRLYPRDFWLTEF
ncbi:hypothetical protein H8E52_05245 [bacterium]|nr:hypothetical protein [bacterium]